MEPAFGVLYLLFCGAVLLVGGCIVIPVQNRFGKNDERDQWIWGAVALGGLAAVWWLASR